MFEKLSCFLGKAFALQSPTNVGAQFLNKLATWFGYKVSMRTAFFPREVV
jgi:hypothetical protein